MSENKRKKSGDPMAKAMDLTIWQSAKTDPQGSYTGTPADPYEVPVQDADDLLAEKAEGTLPSAFPHLPPPFLIGWQNRRCALCLLYI